MDWLSKKWPAVIGLVGFIIITALIWREISVRDTGGPSADGDAFGIAFAVLTLIWWGYFVGVVFASWLVSCWLKSRAIWLLLIAPIVALWFVNKTAQIASQNSDISEIATDLFVATAVAALPILVGASSQIGERILSLRNRRSAISGPTVFNRED
jgi:hypothetical protein